VEKKSVVALADLHSVHFPVFPMELLFEITNDTDASQEIGEIKTNDI